METPSIHWSIFPPVWQLISATKWPVEMFMKLYRRYLQNDAWQVCYMDSSLRDSHTFPNSKVNEYPYFVISGTGDLQALPLRTCDFHFYDSICFQEGIGLHSNQGWWLYCHFSASGNKLPSHFNHVSSTFLKLWITIMQLWNTFPSFGRKLKETWLNVMSAALHCLRFYY